MSRLKVALVGVPNVGKSSIFNRLAGGSFALVSDHSGTTRDIRQKTISLNGHAFDLWDTAGLEEALTSPLEKTIQQGTRRYLEDVDVLFLILDGQKGVTERDKVLARLLRQLDKPVHLIMNKCENMKGQETAYEAYQLGLGEPICLSAAHGDGIGDMWRILGTLLEQHESHAAGDEATKEKALSLVLLGRPNAGKSTLMNALLGYDRVITSAEAGTTRDAIAEKLTYNGHPIHLWDTAGLRKASRIQASLEEQSKKDALRAVQFAHVVILLIDAERGIEKQDLSLANHVIQEGRGLVIALNKWDRIKQKTPYLKEAREKLTRQLAQVGHIPLIPLSAAHKKGLDKLLKATIELEEMWNKRIPTAALNRFLEKMLLTHEPPLSQGRRIRIKYMTQAKTRPPTFIVFGNQLDALPESYQRYLVNGLRETFDLEGIPLRLQLRQTKNPYGPKK